jgi:hypothetical protein
MNGKTMAAFEWKSAQKLCEKFRRDSLTIAQQFIAVDTARNNFKMLFHANRLNRYW